MRQDAQQAALAAWEKAPRTRGDPPLEGRPGRKMVIVGPVHPFRGGIAHFTTSLANTAARAHSVEVLSFRRLFPKILYPGGSDQDPSRSPFGLECPAEYALDSLNPLTWLAAARRIASRPPDFVVVPWWTTFLALPLGWLARLVRRRGVPVIFLVHNVLPHERRRSDRALARWALRGGDGYVVLTPAEKSGLMNLLPRAEVVAVCPHPVYRLFAAGRIDKADARRRLGVPQGEPLLLFFGFVRRYKGVDSLLDAIKLLHDHGRAPYLLVAGEVWDGEARLRRRIESLGIQERVRVDNRYIPNEEVGTYFSAADVFVAPYTAGTQSGSLKIAQDFSLPAVVTETIAPPEGFPEGRGRVVRPGDVPALAQAISEMTAPSGASAASAVSSHGDDGWSDLVATLVEVADRVRAIDRKGKRR